MTKPSPEAVFHPETVLEAGHTGWLADGNNISLDGNNISSLYLKIRISNTPEKYLAVKQKFLRKTCCAFEVG